MTNKTAITNDKPKMRTVGPFGFRVPEGEEAVANSQSRLGYRLPASDRPGHVPPKAIKDEPVANAVKPLSRSLYLLPRGEG